jgi:hypothetical protein
VAQLAVLLVVRRDPAQFGYEHSRWTLAMIANSCPWLRLTTAGGLSQLLKRLEISYKRGRDYVHSPDCHYQEKLHLIDLARWRTYFEPERFVFLYLDELTFYRQPSLARAYEATGSVQPLARRSYQSNTASRIAGVLNERTGQVNYCQRSRTTTSVLAHFWYDIRQAYPQAEQIYILVDNWPVHFHPDVLAPLQDQNFPFPPKLPANWPTQPSNRAICDHLPIQLLCLPTYASWLNPIEKLWRWLKQDVLHLHRFSDRWPELKERVAHFLDGFALGSTQLLRYVGLLPY